MRTIDSFGFSDVTVMKIDVEGFEVEVLRGAEQTIRGNRPVILVEIAIENLGAAELLLERLGYALRRIEMPNTTRVVNYVAVPAD
jgi:hypothetical protein